MPNPQGLFRFGTTPGSVICLSAFRNGVHSIVLVVNLSVLIGSLSETQIPNCVNNLMWL